MLRNIRYRRSPKDYADILDSGKEKNILQLMSESIDEQRDATNVMDKLGSFEALEGAFMKPYHKTLNPLVQMALIFEKNKEIKLEKSRNVGAKILENESFEEAYKNLRRDSELNEIQKVLSQHYIDVLRPYFDRRTPEEVKENLREFELEEPIVGQPGLFENKKLNVRMRKNTVG